MLMTVWEVRKTGAGDFEAIERREGVDGIGQSLNEATGNAVGSGSLEMLEHILKGMKVQRAGDEFAKRRKCLQVWW